MNEEQKLTILKSMIDGSDDDSVLSTYLSIAGEKVIRKAYPYKSDVTEVPEKYSYLQIEIAAYLLNKRGAEGEISHSEGGISRSYSSADVPSAYMNQITPEVGVFE